MKSLRSRAVVYGLVIVLGLLSALPNLLSHNLSGKLPDWYLQNTVSLGLDLQGGSHLLLQADLEDLFSGERQAIAEELARTLREAGIDYGRALIAVSLLFLVGSGPVRGFAVTRLIMKWRISGFGLNPISHWPAWSST